MLIKRMSAANKGRDRAPRRLPEEVRKAEYITTATSLVASSLTGLMRARE